MATIHMQGRVVRDDPPEMVQLPQRDAAVARDQAAAPVAPAPGDAPTLVAGEVLNDEMHERPRRRARSKKPTAPKAAKATAKKAKATKR